MYEELVKSLRICGDWETDVRFPGKDGCGGCAYHDEANDVCNSWDADNRKENIMLQAADAIEALQAAVEREKTYTQFWEDAAKTCKAQYEELLHAAKKMHTWIFLHSGDEQKAYDECGLSDEMNAALGYGGQFELRAEPPKEEPQIISAVDCKDCRYYPPSSTDGKPCCACDPANPLTNCHVEKAET